MTTDELYMCCGGRGVHKHGCPTGTTNAFRARIAELEAEVKLQEGQVQYWTDEAARYCQNVDHWRTRAEQAEAELAQAKYSANRYRELMDQSQAALAALKARRCANCAHGLPTDHGRFYCRLQDVTWPASHVCPDWAVRKEDS